MTKKSLITVQILLIRIFVLLGINITGETIFWTRASPAQVNLVTPSTQIQLNSIKKIEFTGNTVFSDSELQKVLDSYKGQTISLELLQKMGQEIDNYYLKEGYLTSGSFVPSQEVQDGIIKIQIIEAILEEIRFKGLNRLKVNYLKSRLPQTQEPLNIKYLLQTLDQLRKDPLIKDIYGEITEEDLGKNLLLLDIKEESRFDASLTCTNAYSPSIGSFGCKIPLTYKSALVLGDKITVDTTQAEGLSRYGIGYLVLFNKSNSEVTFEYNTANNEIVQEELKDLGIEADFESVALNFSHFIISRSTESLKLGFGVEYFDSETFVLEDISFSFVEGLENGQTKLTILNFNQEYTKNWSSTFLAFKSQFNLGIDAFDATKSELGIDGIFWSWNGDFQVLTVLDPNRKVILAIRVAGQLTPDKLLPLSQITVGGQGTVRGIIRNLGIADNGINGNIELQITAVRGKWGSLAIIPFVDVATIWNNDRETTGTNTFVSAGMGVRCRIGEALEARVDYGVPLNEIDGFGATDIEDNFIFSVLIRPFKF